jgi:hypothetical protein
MSEQISQLSIRALLGEGADYVIPMYQRNYAWGEAEISQLIQDVVDYLPGPESRAKNYYIGTLVVFERHRQGRAVYEVIDGQQRLTTLSLLMSYLKNSGAAELDWYDTVRIRFESRERSQKTFSAIFTGGFERGALGFLAPEDTNTSILNGYRLIQKILQAKLEEKGTDIEDFARYLIGNVVLMRVGVPPQTNLNHYFEIMNSRGEQLEKHEVLKARMMDALSDGPEPERSRHCLHEVWEACANMERYVQMGFTPAQRDAMFDKGDWGRFQVRDFAHLCDALDLPLNLSGGGSVALTLDEIIEPANGRASAGIRGEGMVEAAPERFHSVINFPNFLLQVLRVVTGENVPLDDKALIRAFDDHVLKSSDRALRTKDFVFALLRCKYLFDQYVIKREFLKGKDGWCLKRLQWNGSGEKNGAGRTTYVNTFGADDEDDNGSGNRRILMLLSAFHVSAPTPVYKHWLNAALRHLYRVDSVHETDYLRYLESVARAFVFDRFLAGERKAEYFAIVYGEEGRCQARRSGIENVDLALRLSYRTITNNLVFNYLDYLLWLKNRADDEQVRQFEFTFRSSVEHYYPQKPMAGQDLLNDEVLDSFGNLCLISHSKNSRLSNFSPLAKTDYYRNNRIDSIKQYLMMKRAPWDEAAIGIHGEEMLKVLVASLDL